MPMVCEPLADGVRTSCPQQHKACANGCRGTWAHQGPTGSDGDRATLADGVRASCRWCSSNPPAAAQGMSRWLSRHPGAPRPDWLRWCASQPPAAKQHKASSDGCRATWAHQGSTGSDRVRANLRWCATQPPSQTQGMSQCLSTHLGAPRLDWFQWCATQPPSATQGMSLGWVQVCEPPGRTKARLVRWCASQEPASSSKKHKPRVVDPSGRTKAKLLLMACEPDARSSTRRDPMLVEASGRTKAWPSW